MTPERKERIAQVLSKRQPDLTVVLENVFDPHNISAIMRTCDAVGIQELYVLNTGVPPRRNWGFKSSRSANKWVTAHQFSDMDSCLSALRARYQRILTTSLAPGALNLYGSDLTLSTALVFGNEQNGVSTELQALSDGSLFIPQVGMIRSLNIGVACAVTLYEAYRQRAAAGLYDRTRLEPETFAQLSGKWGLEQ